MPRPPQLTLLPRLFILATAATAVSRARSSSIDEAHASEESMSVIADLVLVRLRRPSLFTPARAYTNSMEDRTCANSMEDRSGLPHIIGAIDTSHIILYLC